MFFGTEEALPDRKTEVSDQALSANILMVGHPQNLVQLASFPLETAAYSLLQQRQSEYLVEEPVS